MNNNRDVWAEAQFNQGMLFLNQPSENYADNLERALTALTNAKTFYTYESHPERWSRIMQELGSVYILRRRGDKTQNLEAAINCYTESLRVYQQESNPREWAECQRGIGRALLGLCDGLDNSIKEQALLHYGNALGVIALENWPELWYIIHLELSILYRKSALESLVNEDLRLAWKHYRIAFSLDKSRYPALYSSMMRLHELYSELFKIRNEIIVQEKGENENGENEKEKKGKGDSVILLLKGQKKSP